jgi:hypothetical protein
MQRKARGKVNKITEDIGTGKPGPGRPKGSLNKTTAAIKDMVTQALDDAGGVDYLTAQAIDNPTAFLTLVGKVLPLQIAGSLDHQVKVSGSLAWKPPQ